MKKVIEKQKSEKTNCEFCGYEVAEYRERWGKVLCGQCNYNYDNPSQEELEQRIGTDY